MTAPATAPPVACPRCGKPAGSTLACLQCGALLDEAPGATHFDRLGVPTAPVVHLDIAERNYLRLSRALHPDFQPAGDTAAVERATEASARLNEAWSVIAEPQAALEYLLELRDPGVMERAKTLSPAFLAEAMELSEEAEVAARTPAVAAKLRQRVQNEADGRLHGAGVALAAAVAGGRAPDTRAIAVLLHEARVMRRILRDLEGPR